MKKQKIFVSIIIPVYKPKKELLAKAIKAIKKQKTDFKYEIIISEGEKGLSKAYNEGIKKSKGEIIVTLHSDCIPLENKWLQKMVDPFKDPNIVLAFGKVKEKYDNRIYYPHPPDGKSTAFRKSSLEKVKLFDEKTFFSGGEDVDIWLKLKKIGKMVKVDTSVLHCHKGYLGNVTVEKRKQNGSINGALFRIWGVKNPRWLKAIILCFIYPTSYGYNFLKAFVYKKQFYRREADYDKNIKRN